jgi:hypothetical protein
MQFTGLYDKNSKEIYEGDVFRSMRGITYIVTWEDGGFIGKGHNSHFERGMSKLSKEDRYLGNIYENPELIA